MSKWKGYGVICFLLLGLFLLPGVASAQEETEIEELEAIYGKAGVVSVVSAEEEPLKEAPVITNVITAEEIKRMGARTFESLGYIE